MVKKATFDMPLDFRPDVLIRDYLLKQILSWVRMSVAYQLQYVSQLPKILHWDKKNNPQCSFNKSKWFRVFFQQTALTPLGIMT